MEGMSMKQSYTENNHFASAPAVEDIYFEPLTEEEVNKEQSTIIIVEKSIK